ncbi:MAG TPA: sulfatase/phosphatase domain-containing protein, partial [Planctomycetaceae bacterium]|nr:sulfatase/phosphatase domain-containing protein [Planctomycetaceae bacterium]
LAGVTAPEGPQPMDGKSLMLILKDPQATIRDHASHCFPRGNRLGRAIRTERYRMVEWKEIGKAAATAEYELYDYQTDPHETRNLASEQTQVLDELKAILARQPEARRSE